MLGTMKKKDQLKLLEAADLWRLDERTRAMGRKGVQDARRALAEARAANRKAA
ncbi:MAG: hypothetical protein JWP02_972 [Acidimicrobiales bacterium]|nr:hypothetical protein [Acidimicrobiales bacterium]